MDLFKKNLLILALITSFGHIAAAPEPQNEHPEAHDDFEDESEDTTPKAPLGLRFRRLITMLFGIPEQYLTPKNFALNAIPKLVEIGSRNSEAYRRLDYSLQSRWERFLYGNPYERQSELCWRTNEFLGKYNINERILYYNTKTILEGLLVETTKQSTAIIKMAPKGFTRGWIYWATKVLLKSKIIFPKKIKYSYVTFVFYTHLANQLFERRSLVKKLTQQNLIVFSRSIPENMHDKEYLMFESPIGYITRRSSALYRLIFDCAKLAIRARRALTVDEPILMSIDSFFHPTSKLGHAIQQAAESIPWIPHAYILKSDFEKLPLEDQQRLYRLMSADYFRAIFKVTDRAWSAKRMARKAIEYIKKDNSRDAL